MALNVGANRWSGFCHVNSFVDSYRVAAELPKMPARLLLSLLSDLDRFRPTEVRGRWALSFCGYAAASMLK